MKARKRDMFYVLTNPLIFLQCGVALVMDLRKLTDSSHLDQKNGIGIQFRASFYKVSSTVVKQWIVNRRTKVRAPVASILRHSIFFNICKSLLKNFNIFITIFFMDAGIFF
jgi:hypothetical protein